MGGSLEAIDVPAAGSSRNRLEAEYRNCAAAGHPVQRLPECVIAVVAMRNDVALLRADDGFDAIARSARLTIDGGG